jgi:Bacterial Ig-like domain
VWVRKTERTERRERTEASPRTSFVSVFSVLSALSVLPACARIEPPPGGPPDRAAPRLIAIRPDSMARIPGFKGNVEFRFDEVISEGGTPNTGQGTGDLEKLIILSPSNRVPDVSWKRNRITVKPSEGWRPDRVYRVQLLPGVTDLRRNRSDQGAVLTFTTGAPAPSTTITGTVVDWSTSRPAPTALAEALLLPDSLPYRAIADSSGRFSLGPLPAGEYLVRGVIDQNRNLKPDPREAFDSVRIKKGTTNAGELWAFEHDTTPARIKTITVADSISATVEFTQMLDPKQRLEPSAATLRILPDSAPVKVISILPKPVDDSIHAKPAAADTTKADTAKAGARRADTTEAGKREADTTGKRLPKLPGVPGQAPARGEPPALKTKPPLFDRLVLRVAQPWKAGGRYVLEVKGIRNVSGVTGTATGALSVPERMAADSLKQKADSLRPHIERKKRTPGDTAAPKLPAKPTQR